MKKSFCKLLAHIVLFSMVLGVINLNCFAGGVLPPDGGGGGGGGYVPPSTGLIAEYRFNGNFKEANGSGMDGVKEGSVVFDDNGVAGQCASFENGYLNVNSGGNLNPGSVFSISVWIKPEFGATETNPLVYKQLPVSLNSDQELFSANAIGTNGLQLIQRPVMTDNKTQLLKAESTGLALDYAWTHVVFVSDGVNQYIYINGQLNTTQKIDETAKTGSYVSNGKLMIGGDPTGATYQGKMDELKIYNKALTAAEISTQSSVQIYGAYTHSIYFRVGSRTMMVDGVAKQIDANNPQVIPYIDLPSGRTMVPIRAIVENMGGDIDFDDALRQVDITLNSITIRMWLDSKMALVNGTEVELDTAAVAIESRTMVPLRFVAENLGADVDWVDISKTVSILF